MKNTKTPTIHQLNQKAVKIAKLNLKLAKLKAQYELKTDKLNKKIDQLKNN